MNLLSAIANTIYDIFRPVFWGHIIRSLFMTIGAIFVSVICGLILITFLSDLISSYNVSAEIDFIGDTIIYLQEWKVYNLLSTILFSTIVGGFVIGTFFFFPVFLTVIISLYSDTISASVEKDNGYQVGEPANIVTGILLAIKLILSILILNILALPLYLFLPFLIPIIYILINSYIFGREYYEMVSIRHYKKQEIKSWISDNFLTTIGIGAIFLILVSIPFINLITPVIMIFIVNHYIGKNNQVN